MSSEIRSSDCFPLARLSVCLSLCLSVCLSVSLSLCLSVSLSLCLSVSLSLCLSVSQSLICVRLFLLLSFFECTIAKRQNIHTDHNIFCISPCSFNKSNKATKMNLLWWIKKLSSCNFSLESCYFCSHLLWVFSFRMCAYLSLRFKKFVIFFQDDRCKRYSSPR
jgi:hypothetical protein